MTCKDICIRHKASGRYGALKEKEKVLAVTEKE